MRESEELALEVEELNAALELALKQRDELLVERDEDLRVVRRVLAAESPRGGVDWAEWYRSFEALREHFAGRTADAEKFSQARTATRE